MFICLTKEKGRYLPTTRLGPNAKTLSLETLTKLTVT